MLTMNHWRYGLYRLVTGLQPLTMDLGDLWYETILYKNGLGYLVTFQPEMTSH